MKKSSDEVKDKNPMVAYSLKHTLSENHGDNTHHEFDAYHYKDHIGRIWVSHQKDHPEDSVITDHELQMNPYHWEKHGQKLVDHLSIQAKSMLNSDSKAHLAKMASEQDTEELAEPLAKTCPRCGKTSANKSNPSGRCSACLKKLKRAKKTPGHWQRAQTKADDALRRQKGKNGTAHKKSSGLGSRKSIVAQTKRAERKTGQKLSPDRKDNGKGYATSNTRMVPEKLNRGRHKVDPLKLRAWRKRMKKSEIDTALLYTLLKSKFSEYPDTIELLKSLGVQGLESYIHLFDIEKDITSNN